MCTDQENEQAHEPVVRVEAGPIGQALANVNVYRVGSDPIVLKPEAYPEWIWTAVGPCRAALRLTTSDDRLDPEPASISLEKAFRNQNRRAIRANNNRSKSK